MTHWARQNLVGAWCPAVSGSDGFLLRDLSGNGNHGTLTNMDPATDWVTSNGYQALDFDQVNDFVTAEVRHRPTSTAQPITVVVWSEQNLDAMNAGIGNRVLFTYGGSTQNMSFYTNHANSTFSGAFTCGSSYNYIVKLKTMPQVGELACLAMVYTGSSISGYLNGILQATDTAGTFSAFSNGTFALNYGLVASQYNGSRVFDARVYHRVLYDAELMQLYAGGPGYGLRPERRRKYYFASGGPAFKPYWVRRQWQVIGGGVS